MEMKDNMKLRAKIPVISCCASAATFRLSGFRVCDGASGACRRSRIAAAKVSRPFSRRSATGKPGAAWFVAISDCMIHLLLPAWPLLEVLTGGVGCS